MSRHAALSNTEMNMLRTSIAAVASSQTAETIIFDQMSCPVVTGRVNIR